MNRAVLVVAVLAVTFLALVVAEQNRPWKRLQAEHRELELARLRARLDAERREGEPERALLQEELDVARQGFDARRREARPLERQLKTARHASRWAVEELEKLRARPAGEIAPEKLREARQRSEERRLDELEIEKRLAELRREVTAAEARSERAGEAAASLERRLAELERGAFWRLVPGLRGFDPRYSVIEVAPPGLARVDRCLTCHLRSAGAAAGEEVWPVPLAPHPGDLVGEGTPHPPRLFGCTVCHGGEGRATDFSRAGHWPADAAQEAEWAEKWGFSRAAAPARPIRPSALVEVGCRQCHEGELRSPAREGRVSLDLGRRLVERMGCAGCHEAGAVKPGPPLGRLAAKTTPGWTFHWIAAPHRFRPTTWMPHLFPPDLGDARRTASIAAMVLYLWEHAEAAPAGDEAALPRGDAEAGARLFASIGCTGCHVLDASASRDGVALERLHGPNLGRTGNKVRAGWLAAWLRDPRSHRADTPMPSLRLTEQEAAHLAAFLMTSRDDEWDALELPAVDIAARDELVLEYLREESTLARSEARLAAMGPHERDLYLGKRSLSAYGCQGCHDIPGLEDAGPVAGPLGNVAAVAHRQDRRVVPDYRMSRREADAVLADLLSRTSPAVEPWRRAGQDGEARVLSDGRRLLARYGCLGCHQLAGQGGAIAATAAGREMRPPDLTSVGARLQSPWLFAYLHDPGKYARRPWLALRMPTFHLQPEETNALVRFFSARDDEPLFTSPPPRLAKREIEVGRAVAAMLRCRGCHHDSPDAEGRPAAELAPSYRGAGERLRPDWVVDWILDPHAFIPDTEMPASFARDDRGVPDSSYLTATVSAPMFTTERLRLLPLFESETELAAYLEDAPRVAVALRDYLWSLK